MHTLKQDLNLRAQKIVKMETLELFMKAREYLVERMEPTLTAFFCQIWDPLCKFVIIKEIDTILKKELFEIVPGLSRKLYPQFKYRIFDDEAQIEISIQQYLNREKELNYLGSAGLGGVVYDLYYRYSYDGNSYPVFISRYGHTEDNYLSGSKTAEAEYYLGEMTPLAIAYGMALEDKII